MSVCVVSPYWGQSVSTTSFINYSFMCVFSLSHVAFKSFSHRLNHGILDPPVAVLLHPGLLDDYSSSLFSCLSEERCWDQWLAHTRAVKQCLRPPPSGRRRNVFLCTPPICCLCNSDDSPVDLRVRSVVTRPAVNRESSSKPPV